MFSGDRKQTIKCCWCSESFNQFNNLVLLNNNIVGENLFTTRLAHDVTINNTVCIDYRKNLDLNGYNFTTNGKIKVNSNILTNGGNIECESLECGVIEFDGKSSKIKGIVNAGTIYANNHNYVIEGDLKSDIIFNKAQLEIKGDLKAGILSMTNDEDYLLVNGDFVKYGMSSSYDYKLSAGTVELKGDFTLSEATSDSFYRKYYNESGTHKTVFSAKNAQNINWCSCSESYNMFNIVMLLNDSESGLIINSKIKVNTLFNHNGYKFTLFNNGEGSSFVDYDGDGLLDHVDPYPTDPSNKPPTQEPTQPPTQEPTQPPTQESTQAPTQEPTQAPTQEPSNSPMLLGDVDGDGIVTIIDATCIQRHLASIPTFAFIEALADADGDGETTILDATYIQRWLAQLPSNNNIGKPIK